MNTNPTKKRKIVMHDMDCRTQGGRKDCPIGKSSSSPRYYAGCYESYEYEPIVPTDTSSNCEHGVVKEYCFNCRFTEKYEMKVKMFNNHHYVRLKDVEKVLISAIQKGRETEKTRIVQLFQHCLDSRFSPEIILDLIESDTHNDELLAEDYGVTLTE